MTIDYITIPAEFFGLTISDKAKMILGLVHCFNGKGLIMSNEALGELLRVRPDSVSKLIGELEQQSLVKITGHQSRHRKIYLGENSKVSNALLREKSQSKDALLRDLPQSTLDKIPNISKRSKDNINKHPTKKIFAVPTLTEIQDYIAEKGLTVDGIFFLEFYNASDWIDSLGHPVKNWKQKLLTWNTRQKPKGENISEPATAECDPDEADRIFEDMKAKGL